MPVEVANTIAALDLWLVRAEEERGHIAAEGAEKIRDTYQSIAPKLSGAMAASARVTRVGDTAFVGPTVVYGRIQEIGGRIPQHPMSHPYLKFVYHGKVVYKHSVHLKGQHALRHAWEIEIPQGYLRVAYDGWLAAQEGL